MRTLSRLSPLTFTLVGCIEASVSRAAISDESDIETVAAALYDGRWIVSTAIRAT